MRDPRLKLAALNPATRKVFAAMATIPDVASFTLVGGTALSLQISHRVSNDLDFAVFSEALPQRKVDAIAARLKDEGHVVRLITDPAKISAFKINTGTNLLNFARDYTVDGVKVTFFAHGRNAQQRSHYRKALVIESDKVSFAVLGIDGLKAAKVLVLADRVRSRDLFDLMVLMRDHGLSIEGALSIAERLGVNDDPEYYKAVLTGKIPLDEDDEGLAPVRVTASMGEIYEFFEKAVEQYEVRLATDFWRRQP